ncbi:MAG: tRNA (adenosine(37)-N6)-threonylcarbamoyltransferase complex dimerization subunit type 1 TsaB [Chlamydiales bacterium]|nr:tRNA (adenosine(37)-N6)-threonylcarbamoyltransferase complex dimerization subunit type 1 TsaB [Chlamydiales bacterium]
MRTLLIDTSCERGIVAICEGDNVLFKKELSLGQPASQYLVSIIHQGLRDVLLSAKELQAIVVGRGPGSYTGLRVGAMVAKTLSYALQIPLIGVCGLEALIPKEDGMFASLIDARMGGAYIAIGKKTGGEVEISTSAKVLPLVDAISLLQEVEHIVTPCIEPIKSKLEAIGLNSSLWSELGPDILQMLRLAKVQFEKKCFSLDGSLDLLYLKEWTANS